MSALESLTPSQRKVLGELRALTNGADIGDEIAVLRSVEWDVQRAANAIYETPASGHGHRLTSRDSMYGLTVDDSHQDSIRPVPARPNNTFLHIVTYPFTLSFNIVSSLLHFVLRVLRIPLSAFTAIWRPDSRRFLTHDPASVADRWVRQLEEETGASRGGRSDVCVSSGVASTGAEAGPGPNTLSRRADRLGEGSRQLPNFHLGSYEEALRIAQRDGRIMCVVLVTEEHDDVLEFKRSTLTDNEFNEILRSQDILVWGGDVRDREAHQASQKLAATTYPFVAFISLQPRSGPRSSTNTAPEPSILTVLSRHQGPSVPGSLTMPATALGPTSARALCNHLNNQLLPRVTPFLGRLRAAKKDRERERTLRDEQDAAFALSAQQDRERIERKMAAERHARLEAEHAERERVEAEQARRTAQEQARNWEKILLQWRRYARRKLLPSEPIAGQRAVRVGIRMPDGTRLVRRFSPTDTLTALYTFVAIQSIPGHLDSSSDPDTPPSEFLPGDEGVSEETWQFRLLAAYPRSEIPWRPGTVLQDLGELKDGGQLVVESTLRSDSAGYDTEEEE